MSNGLSMYLAPIPLFSYVLMHDKYSTVVLILLHIALNIEGIRTESQCTTYTKVHVLLHAM